MNVTLLIAIILGLALVGFIAGRARALSSAGGDIRKLHSRPVYYGQAVLLFTAVPALVVLVAWLFVQPIAINGRVSAEIPASAVPEGGALSLVMSDVVRIADGMDLMVAEGALSERDLGVMRADISNIRSRLADVGVAVGTEVSQPVLRAARDYRAMRNTGSLAMSVVVLLTAVGLLGWSLSRISPEQRARNISESFIKAMLIGASMVAILTTVGIVLSLLFETWHFFKLYPAKDFFFSATWNPQFRGGSDLGILPL
ncbi:MAG TPA: phosphate ABC transporter permease subunit PstC, partial [Rhodobacterales bacterium]|nr:phosphate ABC transporter permease subunit PstC [Rhodobacterales bacterium]